MSQENLEKYDKIFIGRFRVKPEQLSGLAYKSVPAWDSVGHMEMLAEIGEQFDIELEMGDMVDFSSYEAGRKILEKYGIEF